MNKTSDFWRLRTVTWYKLRSYSDCQKLFRHDSTAAGRQHKSTPLRTDRKCPPRCTAFEKNSWSSRVSQLTVSRDASKYCLHIFTVKYYPEIQKLQKAWENPAASLSAHWYQGCCFETASPHLHSRSLLQHEHAWSLWIQTDAQTWPSKYLELLMEERKEKEDV